MDLFTKNHKLVKVLEYSREYYTALIILFSFVLNPSTGTKYLRTGTFSLVYLSILHLI